MKKIVRMLRVLFFFFFFPSLAHNLRHEEDKRGSVQEK